MKPIDAIRQQILQATSNGINATLDAVLADLVLNAPRRTGALASRYRVSDRATLDHLTGTIANSLDYSGEQYPYRIYSPNRYTNGYPAPSLFVPKVSRMGILQPSEVDQSAIERLMKANIEQALREQ